MAWRRIVAAAALVCAVWSAPRAQSPYVWYSLGLDSCSVNCLLVDDTTYILAGTDKGLYVLWRGDWAQVTSVPSNAPVTALARLASGGVVAASDRFCGWRRRAAGTRTCSAGRWRPRTAAGRVTRVSGASRSSRAGPSP